MPRYARDYMTRGAHCSRARPTRPASPSWGTGQSAASTENFSPANLLCAALVNYLFDANYGYLREKPQRASLLDYLGPLPIYIAGLEIVAAFMFLVLYAPFFIADTFSKRG